MTARRPDEDDVSRAEVAAVVELVRALPARLVNIGHDRDPRSRARVTAFLDAWHDIGGEVNTVASWPSSAASWLRQARALASGSPDGWVVASGTRGWCGIGPRLITTGSWWARNTVAFADLADPALPSLAGSEATEGLRGATADGTVWTFREGRLVAVGPRG